MNTTFVAKSAVALAAACVLCGTPARMVAQASSSFPPAAEIKELLVARINNHPGLGIVVGLLDATGKRTIVTAGTAGESIGRPLDGKTVFEIGSATKVFTSVLLAQMVERGDVSLDDPVSKFLPAAVKVPMRGERQITLADLATHTSGLPRLPTNLRPQDGENPYADYTEQHLYEFLSSYALTRDIGAQYEYSNLGAGLLGHALARRAGTSYEAALSARVLAPLGMRETAITLTPALRARLAVGHDTLGYPTANWDLPTLAGAGALRSTADDLLTFLEANLQRRPDRLGPALARTHEPRHDANAPGQPAIMRIGLGWHIRKGSAGETVWHNGGTGGYHSFMAFDERRRVGVVVLHNGATSIDDIALHLLDATIPVSSVKAPTAPTRQEIALASDVLQAYAGRYELAPGVTMTITVDGGRLYLQLTGQGRNRLYAQSRTAFFLKVVDAQVTFITDASGAVTGLVLHQNGRDVPGKRIGS